MKAKRLSVIRVAATAVAIAVPSLMGMADTQAAFPDGKTVTLMVPYGAGGTADATARILAKGLERELKTSFQVVNKPGAASQVGHVALLQAKPDGYTLSYSVLPSVVTHYLDPERQPPYTRKNFQPVAWHWDTPQVIAVLTNSRFKSLRDLVEEAKANPGAVTLSDPGLLTAGHLTTLFLEKAAKVTIASVHFVSGMESVLATLGGHVTAIAGGTSDTVTRAKSGEFRVLAIADEKRSAFLPDVPTMKSQGYDVISVSGGGIVAPAGTPMDVVNILSSAMKKVIESDEHKKDLDKYGGIAHHYMNPQEYEAFWIETERRMEPVLKVIRAK
jgi:tripartite-type tricarboxylate transporter receptor subunit TctC